MYQKYGKRIMDVVVSFIGMLLLLPVIVIVAVLVRINLGSPVLFKQERPGRYEKIFVLYKFRSMSDRKDSMGRLLPDEERLTRFGKKLRNSSLDELPELINILKGDMSLVGPRPLAKIYLPYYTTKERHRHDVRPGLTGLAQVNGRNAISWEAKFAYDLEYINHISLMRDIKILGKTILCVLKTQNTGQGKEAPQSLHIERERNK